MAEENRRLLVSDFAEGAKGLYIWGVSMVGKESVQVCSLDLVIVISMVEGKESAQVCVRGINHMRWGISVVDHNLVCISDISGKAGVLVHRMRQVGVGGSVHISWS